VDLAVVPSTGAHRVTTKEDVVSFHHAAAAGQPPNATAREATLRLPGDEIQPLIGIRNLMAKRMAESKAIIPHFSYFEQVDATRLVMLRHNIKMEAEKEGIHVTYMPLLIRALSLTLTRYPVVNSSVDLKENA